MTSYTIDKHKHITAAWSAATSARASKLCRFSVETGRRILEGCGFTLDLRVDDLPLPEDLDERHLNWCIKAKDLAAQDERKNFSHGVAAKLINSYLKDRFLCGGDHEHPRVRNVHPPIDALLLDALAEENFGGYAKDWKELRNQGWSKFEAPDYQHASDLMRSSLPPGEPRWKIEAFWKGYQ